MVMWLYGWKLLTLIQHTRCGCLGHCGGGDTMFLIHHNIARPCDQRVMWLCKVSHNPANFGDHMHCGSGENDFSLFCEITRNVAKK